ncbi:MAG: hypothetical protein PHF29_06650, partial [Candidatus Riflebacteria bacterium]|nr:hypothetical protein [Candidatus Riflebacteria bacterium]
MYRLCTYFFSVAGAILRTRKGFSLVEALVASLIVGYCLLPVVGTMQSGEKLTERIVHSEKLRMLARSRLNLETSAANNEQKLINTLPNYHYAYMKSGSDQLQFIDTTLEPASFTKDTTVEEVVYTYQVDVAVDDDVYLAPDGDLPPKYVRGLNGLKSLVVTARLLPNATDVEEELTFTLVSLVTVPTVSQQHVWAVDARQNKVLSFDPYTGMVNLSKTIDFPTSSNLSKRPSFVLPHPNNKTLFIYGASGVYGLNTNKDDLKYYAELATYTSLLPAGRFTLDSSKDSVIRNYLNRPFLTAMRPDGALVYSLTKSSDGDIFADSYTSAIPSATNSSGRTPASSLSYDVGVYGSIDTSKVNFLVAGADGNLYFGPIGASTFVVARMPMYGAQLPKYEEFHNFGTDTIIDVAVSPDGETICTLLQISGASDFCLTFQNVREQIIKNKTVINTASIDLTDIEYSGDGKYICLVDKNSGMYLFDASDKTLREVVLSLSSLPRAKSPDSMKPEYVVYSQESNSFIVDDIASPSVVSLDCQEFAANKYSTKIPDDNIFKLAPENDSIVHVNTRKTDYLYVATSDGTAANSNIHCVDQYSGTIDSTREIALSEVPHDIALSAMGDKLSVTYGDALNKVGAYDVINNSKLDINVTESNYAITPLNEGYAKNQRGNTAFTKNYLLSADSKIAGTKNTYAF